MSNLTNDIIAENLFERLEDMEGFMNHHEYADRQKQLLRDLSTGQFDEAQELVIMLEDRYSYERKVAWYEEYAD